MSTYFSRDKNKGLQHGCQTHVAMCDGWMAQGWSYRTDGAHRYSPFPLKNKPSDCSGLAGPRLHWVSRVVCTQHLPQTGWSRCHVCQTSQSRCEWHGSCPRLARADGTILDWLKWKPRLALGARWCCSIGISSTPTGCNLLKWCLQEPSTTKENN